MIPFVDMAAGLAAIGDEIKAAIDGVIASGRLVMGPRLEEFELAFAGYLGTGHAVGVNSGTDAITLALRAAGIGYGDGVVTVTNTAVPTIAAIRAAGALPLFVDIDPESLTMDPEALRRCFDNTGTVGRIKAVVPVHLYGQAADMDPIMEVAAGFGLKVIEDACQAHGTLYKGRKAGTIGDFGCFSFYPTKNLGALGDGGAVVTGDPEAARTLQWLRNYGQKDRYHAAIEGVNSRLDELQAAVLGVKLEYLDDWNEKRRALARIYDAKIDPEKAVKPVVAGWSLDEGAGGAVGHVYHLYVIRHPRRDALKSYLEDNGVATIIHYPVPIHLQEAYAFLGNPVGSFPVSEKACSEVLSLPIYPGMPHEAAEEVARLVNSFKG